ncbi:unnamed protein product [Ambrosiozyma monospora]|uniref:Unnamed protein product n=1 Tax=Ambrosiozyma monospora TaxID=43982 RepID=A0A9W7DM68_AMBMO|nr:unnamed protein product [Ambrosiozyma monospora]
MFIPHKMKRSYHSFLRSFRCSNRLVQSFVLAVSVVSIISFSLHSIIKSSSSISTGKTLSYYEQMLQNNEQDSSIGVKLEADSLLDRLRSGIRSGFNYRLTDNDDGQDDPHQKQQLLGLTNGEIDNLDEQHANLLPEIQHYEHQLKQLIDSGNLNNLELHKGNHHNDQSPNYVTLPKSREDLVREKKLQEYFKNLIQIIKQNKPRAGFELTSGARIIGSEDEFIFDRKYGSSGIINVAVHDHGQNFPILSESYLSKGLKIPVELSKELEKSHMFVVQELPNTYPEDLYHGEGIVMVAGGKFSWLALLSIENLRLVGSQLPVEVIVPTEKEYEKELCEVTFPKLNAKCLLLSDMLPEIKNSKLNIGGYQYKSMALLASSFEKVLLLDSDNIAVSNPDPLFNSEPFTKTGMVLWPDFWRRVTHPDYYKIIDKQLGSKRVRNLHDEVTPSHFYSTGKEDPINSIPLHDREGTIPDGSTESGQLLVNKKSHMMSLQLAFYYNFYGPRHYYPLLAQGSSGEGDKDTFYAAAHYFNHTVYQVKKAVDSIGYWNDQNTRYVGVGMIQYDPISDYDNLNHYETWLYKRQQESRAQRKQQQQQQHRGFFESLKHLLVDRENQFDGSVYNEHTFPDYFTKSKSKPLFVHANIPKLDPVTLRKEKRLFDPVTNHRVRLYKDQPRTLGFDFELRQWKLFERYFCEEGITLSYLKIAGVSSSDYCEFIHSEIEFLEKTTHEMFDI